MKIISSKNSITEFVQISCAYGIMSKPMEVCRTLGVVNLILPPFGETKDFEKEVSHFHTGFEEIYVIQKGTGVMMLNGKAYQVAKGDLIFLPTNTAHHFRAGPVGAEMFVFALPEYYDDDCHVIETFDGFEPIQHINQYIRNGRESYTLGNPNYSCSTLFETEKFQISSILVKDGGIVESHRCPENTEEIYLTISGKAQFKLDNFNQIIDTENLIMISENSNHSLIARTEFSAIVIHSKK